MSEQKTTPLCVDLDGTLIYSDLLYESLLRLLKQRPWLVFLLPLWLYRGRAYLKQALVERIVWDASHLPYQQHFLAWLREQKRAGRHLLLITASHQSLAEQAVARLDLFDEIVGSDATRNLKGIHKRDWLLARYGEGGFIYAGDSIADLKVWQAAAGAVPVNAPASLARRAAALCPLEREFPAEHKAWFWHLPRALRLYQWVKNSLLFVPLLAAHEFTSGTPLGLTILGFLSFSLAASSAYLLNDLLDLDADRAHPRKSQRPLAAGRLPLLYGMALIPLLLGLALALAWWVSLPFFLVLLLYYSLTLSYSFWLKRLMLIDVLCLALLYTIRVLAGGSISEDVFVSHWLLAFSAFLFLSLAFIKRYAEVLLLRQIESNPQQAVKGRGYLGQDLEVLANLGVSSGHLSVLVLALYINSDAVRMLYETPDFLWMMVLVMLYWLSRAWMLTHRGLMHDDPIVFALRDRISHLCLALIITIVAVASFVPLGEIVSRLS